MDVEKSKFNRFHKEFCGNTDLSPIEVDFSVNIRSLCTGKPSPSRFRILKILESLLISMSFNIGKVGVIRPKYTAVSESCSF